jgi:hypothetical protein
MAEDEATQAEETTDSIWAKLGITDPDEQYADQAEDAEVDAEKEDKMLKKVSARVDDLEKKFRQDKLQEAKAKWMEAADPLERDLFNAIAGDTKDPEALDHAITLVKEKAAEMKAKLEQAEAEAREQVQRSWGVANPGAVAQPTDDEQKNIDEAIRAGDTKAGLRAIIGNDPFLEGII